MTGTKNLTEGNIARELIALSLPLIMGNILQQFYNTIDSFIIGRYVGHEAFAAVGIAGSVMNLFIFILNGGCNGFSVIFAELYGQKNWNKLQKESYISLTAGGLFTIGISLLGLFFLRNLLYGIKPPAEAYSYAYRYLWIIFLGLPVTFVYNWCAAALRAAGDTITSLWTLVLSMVINFGLDLIFVLLLHMDTEGTAAATVIAQLFSVIASLLVMKKKCPFFFFTRKEMKMDRCLLRKSVNLGLVSALHQSSLYIGKLLVQGIVNTGGTEVISAYTATSRIEGFANSFGDSGAAAVSVFTAQNYGVGNRKRIKQGLKKAMQMMLTLAVFLSILMVLFTQPTVRLLMGNPSETVIENTENYMKVISCFYVFCFIGSTFVGYYRGTGKVKIPVTGSVLHITIRVILSQILIRRYHLAAVAIATGIGWISVVLYQLLIYHSEKKKAELQNVS